MGTSSGCERIVLFFSISTGLVACEAASTSVQALLLCSVFTGQVLPKCSVSVGYNSSFHLLPNSCKPIGLKLTLVDQEASVTIES